MVNSSGKRERNGMTSTTITTISSSTAPFPFEKIAPPAHSRPLRASIVSQKVLLLLDNQVRQKEKIRQLSFQAKVLLLSLSSSSPLLPQPHISPETRNFAEHCGHCRGCRCRCCCWRLLNYNFDLQ